LPPSCSSRRSLVQLKIAHNRISGLSPDALGALSQLQFISAANNPASSLPAGLAAKSDLLTRFACSASQHYFHPDHQSQSLFHLVNWAEMRGIRSTQEDTLIALPCFRGRPTNHLFGVFDGHSGNRASIYAATNAARFLLSRLEADQFPPEALKDTFADIHTGIQKYVLSLSLSLSLALSRSLSLMAVTNTLNLTHLTYLVYSEGIDCGTTALLCLFLKERLLIANVGDTRYDVAVLQWFVVLYLVSHAYVLSMHKELPFVVRAKLSACQSTIKVQTKMSVRESNPSVAS
jgi:hypothetical protein